MSMKDAASRLLTVLATITSPAVPDKVVQVPPGLGDRVPKGANITSWINLEPQAPDRSDEANKSGLRQYPFTAHYWVSDVHHRLGDAADVLMDMADSLMDALSHNTLAGWARQGIMLGDTKPTMEGGGDDDTLYVVRLPFVVWKQEPPAAVPWTPSELTTALWLDCSDAVLDASSNVYMLPDISGNNRHAIQVTANLRPPLSGGVPSFNGSSHMLNLFGPVVLDVTSGMTIVEVYNRAAAGVFSHGLTETSGLLPFSTSWQSSNITYSGLGAVGYSTHGGAVTTTGDYISLVRRNATTVRLWRNGTEVGTAQTALSLTGAKTFTCIGKLQTLYYHSGKMYEIIAIPSEVSETDRQKLEGYLAHKWGMTANLPAAHPYKTALPYV